MRTYSGIAAHALPDPKSPDFVPRLRDMLTTIDLWARDASFGFGRIEGGQTPSGGGTDLGGVSDHGLLSGLGDDDHAQYLLLAGRAGGSTLGIVDANPVLTTSIAASVSTPHVFSFDASTSFGSNYVMRVRNGTTLKMVLDWTGRMALGGVGHVGFSSVGAVLTLDALSSSSTHIDMWADASQGVDIVKSRDSGLNVLAGLTKDHYWYARRFLLSGSTSGQITLSAGATPTTHTLTLPATQGAASSFLQNDGSGGLSWATSLTGDSLSVGAFGVDVDGNIIDGMNMISTGSGNTSFFDFSGIGSGQTYSLPNTGGTLLTASNTVTLTSKTLGTSCNIRCNTGAGVTFQDNTSTTKQMRLDLSGITAGSTRNLAAQDLAGTLVLVGNDPPTVASGALGKVDLTAQTANIATTNLSSTPPAGLYAVEVYIACTTADVTAGTLAVTIGWTDVLGATTTTPVTGFALTATGRASGRQLVQVASGDITYAVAVTGAYGTSQYAVYVRVLALG